MIKTTGIKTAGIKTTGIKAVGSLLLMLLISVPTMAFELAPESIRWQQPSIPIAYDPSGCSIDILGSSEQALETWDSVKFISVEYEGIGFDSTATVYCAEDDLAELIILPDNVELRIAHIQDRSSNLIVATAHFYWMNGSILDCDIRLHPTRVTEQNLDQIMLHEWGHCLGLDHSSIESSIMWYVLQADAMLHADDLLAKCLLYGSCSTMMDDKNNLFLPKIEFEGACYYAIIDAGTVWPDDAYMVGTRDCNSPPY